MIVAVTAYVPIPGHPRSPDEYHKLAAPLCSLAFEAPILSRMSTLEECWLHEYLAGNGGNVTHSVSDNPQKNTMNYHIVQAQKTEFLVDAAEACNMEPDVFVWIDYGIFHVPGVTPNIIREFLKRADGEEVISIPGCWDKGYTYDDNNPCWRFCGGVMVVPRKYVVALDAAMKSEYARWIDRHNNVSWEVNTLARVEQNEPELPIWWYKANHDASIFTNYRSTRHADRGKYSPIHGFYGAR
jgi:hypothetical protein